MTRGVNQLAEVLIRYREFHHLSQPELAAELGMTKMSVCDLERGKTMPAISTIKRVAALVGWTPEEAGQLILALPLEPVLYVVEGVDGSRPAGRRADHAQEDERADLGGPGEGDRPRHGDGDQDGEGERSGVGAGGPDLGDVLSVDAG